MAPPAFLTLAMMTSSDTSDRSLPWISTEMSLITSLTGPRSTLVRACSEWGSTSFESGDLRAHPTDQDELGPVAHVITADDPEVAVAPVSVLEVLPQPVVAVRAGAGQIDAGPSTFGIFKIGPICWGVVASDIFIGSGALGRDDEATGGLGARGTSLR